MGYSPHILVDYMRSLKRTLRTTHKQPFAACYWDTPEGRAFSLRSSDDGADVAEVAKQYGGGGHRNAAGFKVSYAIAATFEIPD
jgi:nanoRNase/pAp phosphatase (c-di-AMP/oligoRNAs hydrolase)